MSTNGNKALIPARCLASATTALALVIAYNDLYHVYTVQLYL